MEKKKGSLTRKNFFRLSSLLLLFALLFNLTYIPCYFYIRHLNRDSALAQSRQKLETGAAALGTAVQALSNMDAIFLRDSDHLALLDARSDALSALQLDTLRGMIHTYLSPYGFLMESGLTRGDNILFTRTRLYYPREELQVDRYFHCAGMSAAEFVRQFSGRLCVLPAADFDCPPYRPYTGLTVACRWSLLSDTYFFATMPLEKVFALVAEPGVLASGGVLIACGEDVIARQNFPDGEPAAGDEILSCTVESLGMNIRVRVPNALIEARLTQLRRLVFVFLSMMIAATVIWIVGFTLAAVRPVNRVMASLENSRSIREGMDGGKHTAAELARSIDALDSRIASYEELIATQREHARVQILEKALYRGLYTEEERAAFHAAYPRFPAQWRMALLQYAPEESDVDGDGLTFLFTEFLQQRLARAILLPTQANTLLVILSSGPEEKPRAALEELCAEVRARYGLLFSFVLSPVHAGPQSLAAAYQQMEYESNSALEMGLTPRREKMPLSLQQLQTMYMALSCGDETMSLATLAECARAIREKPDFILSKCAYRMIANMLVMVRLEAPCDLSDATIPAFSREEIPALFETELPRCFRRICEKITDQRKNLTQDLMDGVLSYIQENLGNPLLCISLLTDRFSISAPTLQKRLHAAVGQTFSAYVENARMNKARQELIETDRTVQEISEDCGYATPNSFYKAYKRKFGEAPLDLRKNGREE